MAQVTIHSNGATIQTAQMTDDEVREVFFAYDEARKQGNPMVLRTNDGDAFLVPTDALVRLSFDSESSAPKGPILRLV